jgi:hypothetical protein
MVWWHVGIAALVLVLAALGAVVALRGRATTPVVFLALTGLLFVGLYGAAWFLVLPDEPARRVAGAAPPPRAPPWRAPAPAPTTSRAFSVS